MNKKKIFFGLCTALALAGCSSDETLSSTDEVSDGTVRYMRVNIVSTPSGDTRTESTGDPNGNSIYEDGTGNENAITNVRFYFFTDDGSAVAIKANGTNYYDYTKPATGAVSDVNVEENIEATVVINTAEGDRIPSKIIAVVNPDLTVLGSSNLSLTTLRNKTYDFATKATDEGRFVMVNSVYRDAGLQRVDASAITSANMAKDEASALANPVVMYVERNVAKVTLKSEVEDAITTDEYTLLPIVDKEGKAITGDNKPIYLKVSGWNLTATTTKAYLSKHINTAWKVDLFGSSTPWNHYPYFRSYWATNVSTDDAGSDEAGKTYISYNAIGTNPIDADKPIYTNENAATNYTSGEQRAYPTQAIIAGQLVYADGEAINMGEFGGSTVYSQSDLISTMVGQFKDQLYKQVPVGDNIGYQSIGADDVELIAAEVRDKSIKSETTTGRYYVELRIKDQSSQWYTTNDGKGTAYKASDAVIENILASTKGKMWKAGNTYYAFKIKHLAEKNIGEYGVVRNHSYKVTINKVVGLGTPVYDPSLVIYPETPVDEDTYIAAQINVLSWRVVPSKVNLGE